MSGFATPQDAEDAFYDAIEEQDLETLETLWEEGDDIACLLPMKPLFIGRQAVLAAWQRLFDDDHHLDIQVKHLAWVEAPPLAIHYVEEQAKVSGQDRAGPPLYATNIYRKGADGWHLILHQNAPAPPPPGLVPPMGMDHRG